MSLWSEALDIIGALASQDPWLIKPAMQQNGAWLLGAVATFVGGLGIALIYRSVAFVERHLERTVLVVAYLAIALIIFWGVIDRFVFNNQQPWSTTIPPLLFMIMAWFGAAYNVRLRTHLSFSEFRTKMPRAGQYLCLWFDFFLWFGFALILFVTTVRQVVNSVSNFQIVLGTDNVMTWWFLITAPIAAILISARAFQNILEDRRNWREGQPLIKQAVIGGDV